MVIACDQIAKLLVKGVHIPVLGVSWEGMQYGASKAILGDFLRLTYIENPGMAFGIDIGGKLFFSVFSIVASVAILYYLYHSRHEPLGFRIALAVILGGAVGNLIDRVFYGLLFDEGPLFYGRVVDFVDVDFFDVNILGYHLSRWPVFNVADASVTIGVVLLLLFHQSTSASGETDNAPAAGESLPQLTDPVVDPAGRDVLPSSGPSHHPPPSAGRFD
jgi:signal peptidase II